MPGSKTNGMISQGMGEGIGYTGERANEPSKNLHYECRQRPLAVTHPPSERRVGQGTAGPSLRACGNVGRTPITPFAYDARVRTNLTVVPGSLDLPAVDRTGLKMPTAHTLGSMGH